MNPKLVSTPVSRWALLGLAGALISASGAPVVLDPELSIRNVMNTGSGSFQLARNPVDGALYYLKGNGQLYRVNLSATPGASTSTQLYTSADHQVTSAAGMAFGLDGSIYLTSNATISNNTYTVSTVTKGIYNPSNGTRIWSVLATARYPGGSRIFNHQMNAILVSRDGQSLFVNIGARTDHGEVQTDGGTFPGVREVGLTTVLLRLPIGSSGLVLPNDREQLRTAGYLYSEGLRNTFDLAYSPNGDLFGTENGPDRDMPEEINWLREGLHYGYPWKMGNDDNPQQFSNYNASQDKLLNPSYTAVKQGTYTNDPSYPPSPNGFTDPVINVGPDADMIRDPVTGGVIDASDTGRTLGSLTGHRCPLGLSFDDRGTLGSKFQGHGFVVSWTPGLAAGATGEGVFGDPSQDLLHLELTSLGTNYQMRTTRIVGGFSNPVDTVIIGNQLYVLENGGNRGLWEITFPEATGLPVLTITAQDTNKVYGALLPNFIARYTGFVNGDTTNNLTTQAVLSTTATASAPVGGYPIAVSGGSSSNYTLVYVPGTLTVTPTGTTGSLTSSTNPALPGQAVSFTLTLSAVAPGAGTPTGNVQFKVAGANAGGPVALNGGAASYSSSALGHGFQSVVAEYAGDGNFLGTTNLLAPTQVINTPPVAGADTIERDPTNGVKVAVATLLSNDTDADGDPLAFLGANATSANGGTVVSNGGWLFYTPLAGYTNTDTFTCTISDGIGVPVIGTVTVNVRFDNGPSPNLTISDLGGGAYSVRGDGIPDRTYRIEFADDAGSPNWQTLGTATTDSTGVFTIIDTGGSPQRFYRSVFP